MLYAGLGGLVLLVLAQVESGPPARAAARPRPAPPPHWAGAKPYGGELIDWYQAADGRVLVRTDSVGDGAWTPPKLSERAYSTLRHLVDRWLPLLQTVIDDAGLSRGLVMSILFGEGGTDPRAVSPAGAVGLFQLMPAHWGGRTKEQMMDPVTSCAVACGLLRSIRDSRSQITPGAVWELPAIASRYNAGSPDGVRPWTNGDWLGAGRRQDQLSRWGYAAEPGYIDRVVGAYNSLVERGPA